jgi:hypothetical protein
MGWKIHWKKNDKYKYQDYKTSFCTQRLKHLLGHIPPWLVLYYGQLQRLHPTVMLPGVPGSEQHQKDTNASYAKWNTGLKGCAGISCPDYRSLLHYTFKVCTGIRVHYFISAKGTLSVSLTTNTSGLKVCLHYRITCASAQF